MGLHSTLPGLFGFARNDIPDRSFNRIEVPPPLQLSNLSPGAHALPVAWRWRTAEVTKNGLKEFHGTWTAIVFHVWTARWHVWTARWQELSYVLQHWSGAVTCPAC